MEGFVNEKVYDIDTKEKLLDIIQSKEARDNFLEFIYDHHSELEKWQQYYQERSRIRIIEWLRSNHFTFVFEEDLDIAKSMIEKLKRSLFDPKAGKDIVTARKLLFAKSKTYYSSEALNPRPKRGRPPKQAVKLEVESQITTDIYTTVPLGVRHFLFIPDISSPSAFTFSSKFGSEADLLSSRKLSHSQPDVTVESLNQKLAALRSISNKWVEPESKLQTNSSVSSKSKSTQNDNNWNDEEEDDEDEDEDDFKGKISLKSKNSGKPTKSAPIKKTILPVPAKPEKKAVPVNTNTNGINRQPQPNGKKQKIELPKNNQPAPKKKPAPIPLKAAKKRPIQKIASKPVKRPAKKIVAKPAAKRPAKKITAKAKTVTKSPAKKTVAKAPAKRPAKKIVAKTTFKKRPAKKIVVKAAKKPLFKRKR